MMREVFLIGIGGFFGSISRYLVYVWFSARPGLTSFPWATLVVNLFGCFLIGVISLWLEKSLPQHRQIYLFCSVGFLGAFTTFSAFGIETLLLLKNSHHVLAIANISLNIVVGLIAVFCGRTFLSLFI